LAAIRARFEAGDFSGADRYHAFKDELEAFASTYRGTEVAVEARLWQLRLTWWLRKEGSMRQEAARLADEILADCLESRRLDQMCECSYVFSPDQRRDFFGGLAEQSPHSSVRAAALYDLACLEWRSRDEVRRERARDRMGRLAEEYGTEPYRHASYGEMAWAHLNQHSPQVLAVGRPAPEAFGQTHDARFLSLHAHLGKVVLLIFWEHG
jgi:hypothetical protein